MQDSQLLAGLCGVTVQWLAKSPLQCKQATASLPLGSLARCLLDGPFNLHKCATTVYVSGKQACHPTWPCLASVLARGRKTNRACEVICAEATRRDIDDTMTN